MLRFFRSVRYLRVCGPTMIRNFCAISVQHLSGPRALKAGAAEPDGEELCMGRGMRTATEAAPLKEAAVALRNAASSKRRRLALGLALTLALDGVCLAAAGNLNHLQQVALGLGVGLCVATWPVPPIEAVWELPSMRLALGAVVTASAMACLVATFILAEVAYVAAGQRVALAMAELCTGVISYGLGVCLATALLGVRAPRRSAQREAMTSRADDDR